MSISAKAIKSAIDTTVSVSDTGKVKLGGQGPIFRKPTEINVSDSGNVRLGGQGPIFR